MGGAGDGVRDVASLGGITPESLRETFPQWRIFRNAGGWWATREGMQKFEGSQSLLQRVLCALDLAALAEKLCLQEWLDGLDETALAAVYWHMLPPGGTS